MCAAVEPASSKRGPKPKKGERLPTLASLVANPATVWCPGTRPGYGGEEKTLGYRTGVCLWHTPGQDPVPVRWALVRYEEHSERPDQVSIKSAAFLCSAPHDPVLTPEPLLACFGNRWNIEVTFAEMRAHLGLETQRHWSRRAVGRSTPCLFGLFSLIVLMAHRLPPHELPLQQSRWYRKEEATFSDVLGGGRVHLWGAMNYTHSASETPLCLIAQALWRQLQRMACYAT